jgi:membrane-associated protease RseP (regulator of RpoE activity)
MSDFNSAQVQIINHRQAMRPTAKTYAKHVFWLLLTFCTITIAGVLQPFGILPAFPDVNPQTWSEVYDFVLSLPILYFKMITGTIALLLTNAEVLKFGLSFSLSLIFILISHELGHYIACRIYRVDATLPFFIPTPPLIGPAGTFGAFIKILSPLPSRRATFDIGVAGPIAGFVALIPVAVAAFLTLQQAGTEPLTEIPEGTLVFGDPLFFHFLAWLFGVNLQIPMIPNPFYAAAWIGLLVTALNLIPSGQLDGGHAVYAVFGENFHFWTGRIAFVVMLILAVLGVYFFNSPSGILFAVLLGIMMRIRHPAPLDDTPLDFRRILIAVLTLLIFVLCFTPFPIKVY